MRSLKFQKKLVELILSGKKNVTWRLFDDKNLQKGNEIDLINSDTGEKFARATITEVREKKLDEIVEQDFEGHEKYASKEEMYETYQKYYGDKVTPETMVKIIGFHIL